MTSNNYINKIIIPQKEKIHVLQKILNKTLIHFVIGEFIILITYSIQ